MQQHIDTIKQILNKGDFIDNDRSKVGMFSLIGIQEKYSLVNGKLPLITTRKINFDKTLHELIWFLKGNPNVSYLDQHKVPFWKKWTSQKTQSIGPMYPLIWRQLPVVFKDVNNGVDRIKYIDQLKDLIEGIEHDPYSRRHYLSNVNLGMRPDLSISPIENIELGNMALDTCHREFFVSVRPLSDKEKDFVRQYRNEQSAYFNEVDNRPIPEYKLNTVLTMRSNDVMVGKPHNVAQYATMNFILAHVLNMHPGNHVHQVSDAHVYASHGEQALLQCTRDPYPSPDLYLSLNLTQEALLKGEVNHDWFYLNNYQSHPAIALSLEG